jgi:2-iminobutanoate/2-iminopropanoate deaminase
MRSSQSLIVTLVALAAALFSACESRPRVVYTDDAPKPVGPFSQAEIAGNFVFAAGQLGIDPKQGKIVSTTADGQMSQAIANMFAVLKAAGSGPDKLVKVTIYFKDLDDLDKVNVVYEHMLGNNRPPRAAVQVDRIPLDALIEIDYIAEH